MADLEPVPALGLGALTPLLVESKHCQVSPAARGRSAARSTGSSATSPTPAMCVGPVLAGAGGEAALILASTGAIFVLVAAGLGLYARHAQAKAAHQDWIFRNGIKGSATILEVGNSHTTVNEMPLMKLRLALDIPGVGRSEVTRREVMPVGGSGRVRPRLVSPAPLAGTDPS